MDAGSSPHTRGTHVDSDILLSDPRFIPAYAGNAGKAHDSRLLQAVHPRIRGERRSATSTIWLYRGSSPHTRGTQEIIDDKRSSFRFIPAYAGNAHAQSGKRWSLLVHPRIRGERRNVPTTPAARSGSSPHTRGTRSRGHDPLPSRRFIPAYAGNAYRGSASFRCGPVHPRIRGERFSAT